MAVGTSMQEINSLALLVRQLRWGVVRLAYNQKPVLNRVKRESNDSAYQA